jgi:hypothetical protein
VKIAPAGEKDLTPPSSPTDIQAVPISYDRIEITWEPASDPETGIAVYQIYRDGQYISTVKGWSYIAEGLSELTEHRYQIQTVNYHGVESPLSEAYWVQTLADNSAPQITSASGFHDQLAVTFSEPVSQETALEITNYRITGGVNILDAILDPDGRTVFLTTTNHLPNESYRLHVENIQDKA